MSDEVKMPTERQAEALRIMIDRPRFLFSGALRFAADGCRRRGWSTAEHINADLCAYHCATDLGRRALQLYESKHGPINKEPSND